MSDNEYIALRQSQIDNIKRIPFYYKNASGEFSLYKKEGNILDGQRVASQKFPDLFIRSRDRKAAVKELTKNINIDLARSISQKGLKAVRTGLNIIVEEMLSPGGVSAVDALPQTIELLLAGYSDNQSALKSLAQIATHSSQMVAHTVNVAALTLQYALFHEFGDERIQQLMVCAFTHDIGSSQIDSTILDSRRRLSDRQFSQFKTHPVKGHDMLIVDTDLDVGVATVALEHHERIDGSGYPNGIRRISEDSQIIGLIDCFEPLSYRDKDFRKAKSAYDTLTLLKKEVRSGRFDKALFKSFISCLIR